MKIVFVGLTNKVGKQPLDESTATGKVISEIIDGLGKDFEFHKINLVQYAPVDDDGKLRYPNKQELSEGVVSFNDWVLEHNPNIIVLLGGIVSKAVKTDNAITVQHPAYAIRRGLKQQYVNTVVNELKQFATGIIGKMEY